MKQSALVLREMEGGRFYILTKTVGVMDWSCGREEESLKQNILQFGFSVTSATRKLKLIHLRAESRVCPTVHPPTSFPFHSEYFNPRLPAEEKSETHVDCFSSKGAESKESDTASQSKLFSISTGGFLLVVA